MLPGRNPLLIIVVQLLTHYKCNALTCDMINLRCLTIFMMCISIRLICILCNHFIEFLHIAYVLCFKREYFILD